MKDIHRLPERKNTPTVFKKRSLFPSLEMGADFNRAIDVFTDIFHQLNSPLSVAADSNATIFPNVDIVEDDDMYKVELEMPGLSEQDIKVSLDKHMLTVHGEKSVSQKDERKNYLRREIDYGCYERSIALPDDLDTEHAKASFKKGMLWVCIPKNPETLSKKRDLKIEKSE